MKNDYLSDDTIVAISTAEGEGGIAVLRISGQKSIQILKKIFSTDIDSSKERKLIYGKIVSPDNKIPLDTVLATIMKAPQSYTGEDVVEIYSHGGHILPKRILQLISDSGARIAGPGEFTKRAFLNGKMDLTQAESVINIISAQSEAGLIQAELQLSGALSDKINAFKDNILDIYAEIEAQIDFPEEDIDPIVKKNLHNKSQLILNNLNLFIDTYNTGKVIKNGVYTAIVGKPNVGKSSLLNLLLKEDRAIVSPIPGTTRDYIEEKVNINGLILRLIDTAGIRSTSENIEKLGVDLALTKIRQSNFVIMVFDGSNEIDENDIKVLKQLKNKNIIAVINKKDLNLKINIKEICNYVIEAKIVYISAKNGDGYSDLCELITDSIIGKNIINESPELYLTEVRHKNSLTNAYNHLNRFLSAITLEESLEIMSMELRSALDFLGEITGEVTNEDLLGKIFSKFCIGK